MTLKTREHESFGILNFSKISHSKPVTLFGSSITHNNTITLQISNAEENRDLNRSWYFERDRIVQIEMSNNQFTDAITNMNTAGIPVTIKYIKNKEIADYPYINVRKQFEDEFQADIEKIYKMVQIDLKNVIKRLKDKRTLKVKDRREIATLLNLLCTKIISNLPFVQSQFNKQMENSILEATSEIEAFFNTKIYSLGSKKLIDELEKNGLKSLVSIEDTE